MIISQKRLVYIFKNLFLLNLCLLPYFFYSIHSLADESPHSGNPLFVFVKEGNISAVRNAVISDYNVNVADSEGWTVLHHAAYRDHAEIVKILIAGGANLYAKNHRGQTPLSLINGSGVKSFFNWDRLYTIRILKDVKNQKKKQEMLNTMMFDEIKLDNPNLPFIKLVIRSGANPNVKSRYRGWTPLHYFAHRGDLEGVKFLMEEAGAYESQFISSLAGRIPWGLAKDRGHEDVYNYIISFQNVFKQARKLEIKKLFNAIEERDHETVISKILSGDIDVNVADSKGWTPLHYAAYLGDSLMVKILIAGGADVNIKNKDKQTPLSLIKRAIIGYSLDSVNMGRLYVSKILKDVKNQKKKQKLLNELMIKEVELSSRNLSLIKLAIRAGADPNTSSVFESFFPLHYLVGVRDLEGVKLLVNEGARLDLQSLTGRTPMDIARGNQGHSSKKAQDIVEFLESVLTSSTNQCQKSFKTKS